MRRFLFSISMFETHIIKPFLLKGFNLPAAGRGFYGSRVRVGRGQVSVKINKTKYGI
jgi:hypothetical protein